MSICDRCIHDYVCGLEDNHEEGIVSCADMIPKDVPDKIRAEIEKKKTKTHDAMMRVFAQECIDIIDKYRIVERIEE